MKLLTIILCILANLCHSASAENLFSYKQSSPFVPITAPAKQTISTKPAVATQRKLIQIEAQVIEVSQIALSNIGFDFSQDKEAILETFQYLLSNGSAHLLAKPRISALEKETAIIQIGDRIPYAVPAGKSSDQWTVQYLDTGVKLKIIAECEGDSIVVEVQPEVSHVSQWVSNLAGSFPIISTRESKTKVRVKNNEPIIIGGLLNEQKRNTTTSVPLLGDIPFLGEIFKNNIQENIQTDIVFIIVPKIIM